MLIKSILEESNRLESMQEEAPHQVWTLISPSKRVFSVSGNQVALEGGETDYGTISQWRVAINWLAEQFGGEVEWEEED